VTEETKTADRKPESVEKEVDFHDVDDEDFFDSHSDNSLDEFHKRVQKWAQKEAQKEAQKKAEEEARKSMSPRLSIRQQIKKWYENYPPPEEEPVNDEEWMENFLATHKSP
jgi:hypothetical protein